MLRDCGISWIPSLIFLPEVFTDEGLSVSSTRMVTFDFSMLLATKTHTSFGITLMRHKNTQMQMS